MNETPPMVVTVTRKPGTYRDKAYKSRTLVLPDGRTFAVERGRIETHDPALIAWLDQQQEFERLPAEPAAEPAPAAPDTPEA